MNAAEYADLVKSQLAVVAAPSATAVAAPTTAPSRFAQIATAAIERGERRVLPIEVGGKNPAIKWAGSEIDVFTTPMWTAVADDWVNGLAMKFPDLNACVIAKPDEQLFIDGDTAREFIAGYEKFSGEKFPATYTTSARDNRTQMHFQQTDATRGLGNVQQFSVNVDGVEIDLSVRQRNMYVLAEGSRHPSGSIYKCVVDAPIAVMPNKLVKYIRFLHDEYLEQTGKTASGERDFRRDESGKIPQGEIHPFMLFHAGRLRNAGLTHDEIETVLMRIVHQQCEPPIDDAKVKAMAASVGIYPAGVDLFPNIVGEQVQSAFKHPAVDGTHRDYVVNPVMGQNDGWFPRGSVSLIGGSSGSNKTTWALDLFSRQARGEDVWGHTTNKLPYIVFMFDRGKGAHKRTMERLGLKDVPVRFLPPVTDGAAVTAILDHLEAEPEMPQIVFVEGADMLVGEANKGAFVVPFMSALQRIAEHYHIAVVLSVGAPKTKAGEGYTAKRDSILGSEKWSRMSETVVAMQFVEGDDTDDRRACFILLRNGAAERFNLTIAGGRLALDTAPRPEKPTTENQVGLAKDWYSSLFAAGEGRFKPSITLDEHRKALMTTSLPPYALVGARKELGIYYDQKKKVYAFVTNPNGDAVTLN